MTDDKRYRLAAYVTAGGEIVRQNNMGTRTFSDIWNNMPVAARWAVMETMAGDYLVADLQEVVFNTRLDVALSKWMTQPDEESAIACAVMVGDPPLSLAAKTGMRRWLRSSRATDSAKSAKRSWS